MIPGLSSAAEALLHRALDPRATVLTAAALQSLPMHTFGPHDPELMSLGITARGNEDLTIVVTDPSRSIGRVTIEAGARGGLLFFDNRASDGGMHANLRLLGHDSAMIFIGLTGYIALHDVFLRSDGQLLFWGAGSTSVGTSIELEGDGRLVQIGDDALLSAGIWIRNHDMHALHDLNTGALLNEVLVDTIVERHVWVGQSAMLHGCRRVGLGAVIGAGAFVKGEVEPCVAMAGVPARVVRRNVSWGRERRGMTAAERAGLGLSPI